MSNFNIKILFTSLSACLFLVACGGGGGGSGSSLTSIKFDQYEIEYKADGSVAGYQYLTVDSSGKIYTNYMYDSPGNDASWFTSDDQLVSGVIDEYNNDNNLIKRTKLDNNKTVTEYTDYVYDSSGKLTNEIYTNLILAVRSYKAIFAYNSAGNVVLITYADSVGNVTGYDIFVYDAQNRLVKKGFQSADGTLIRYDERVYDSTGNMLSSARNIWDAATASYLILYKQVYQYDANNNNTSFSYYGYDNVNSVLAFSYKYVNEYDLNNRHIKSTLYTGNIDGTLLFYSKHDVLAYDGSGNLTSRQYYDITGLLRTDTYTYDASNNKTLYESLDIVTGKLEQIAYQYDSANVCINIDNIVYDSTGYVMAREVMVPATGVMLNYTEFSSITIYSGPGPDGTWFTDDDTPNYHYVAQVY